ncbi:hypothetical protein LTS18_010710, partial [Coniosporium uncinatum]
MKALASRPPPTSNLSISSAINALLKENEGSPSSDSQSQPRTAVRARRLSEALSDLHLDGSSSNSLSHAKLAALASPCFFHKRFDDAVNIDKVLEEIQDDEGMSHSRLVQTATGVREVSKQLQRRPIRRAVRNIMIVTKARDNQL